MNTLEARVKKLFEKELFARELDARLIEARDGYAKVEVEVKPRFANMHGFAHGGLIFTVADFAFAVAVNIGGAAAGVQFNLMIFRPAPVGEILIGEARQIYRGRSMAAVELKVTNNQGHLIAEGQAIALPVRYSSEDHHS